MRIMKKEQKNTKYTQPILDKKEPITVPFFGIQLPLNRNSIFFWPIIVLVVVVAFFTTYAILPQLNLNLNFENQGANYTANATGPNSIAVAGNDNNINLYETKKEPTITIQQTTTIVTELKKYPPESYAIFYKANDLAAENISSQIARVLNESNWFLIHVVQSYGTFKTIDDKSIDDKGILVQIVNNETPAEKTLIKHLNDFGFATQIDRIIETSPGQTTTLLQSNLPLTEEQISAQPITLIYIGSQS